MDPDNALRKIRTAGSLSISPELFEKIYLAPEKRVAGDLRKRMGNPTPLGLIGFLLCLTPLSCDLMGWRGAGAGGAGAAGIATYFYFGGLLMIISGFLEWVLGNTFPFIVFSVFGAFWLSYAGTLQDGFYGAVSAYASTVPEGENPVNSVGFRAGFGFFLLFMGFFCLICLVCSLRTNLAFFMIFFTLVLTFGFLTGAFWQVANGNPELALKLQIGGGACGFCTTVFGWWIFIAIILASVDFPINVPVGDLSTIIKGGSERAKNEEGMGKHA
ncbi:hypothetical protein K431DRAFT_265964 [Polychaeton citri CBS 116435]|uniref:GPR1/FUN34/YaaH-class plasma membrane protein n=1 Tax=Polychaeton citri CBS 116435 TaxID=1314669 RepID=A0A9P4QBB9_9PEZI|nr:hypothetical protein K431DRAFT_265964 [Polychaeton citri CBS 116435]